VSRLVGKTLRFSRNFSKDGMMSTPYKKGADTERELQKLLEDKFKFRVFRVAGSHEVDLVIAGFPIEVKRRKTVPDVMMPAFHALLADGDCVGGPPDLFFSDVSPMQVGRVITPAWKAVIPEGGLLAIRLPLKGFALFAFWQDFVRIRRPC